MNVLKTLSYTRTWQNLRGNNFKWNTLKTMSTMSPEHKWRGVPLSEIYGAETPWGCPEFPLVSPTYNHTVLYHIPNNSSVMTADRPPKPQIGSDKWDHNYVRMPCSNQSLYPVENLNGDTNLSKRWEIIEKTLARPIQSSEELAAAILSYNTKFKSVWKFRALHELFNQHLEEEEAKYFFDVTLPQIAKLALDLPKLIQSPIPLLRQHKNHSISLSQQQIASLLANAFFCTFPRRNTTKASSEYASYPHINLNILYECRPTDAILEKLKCICHYFKRVCTKVPIGVLTFCRRSVPPRQCPDWKNSPTEISTLPVHVDPITNIEDASGLIQVDFANKYLGGGVIGHGCVQEEIRFVICPELMVSMLFTEVLRPNEALMMIGCERYSNYTGYGNSFQWTGNCVDMTPRDSSGRRRCAVLAIDALPYSDIAQEYRKEVITRELNKAWVGLSFYTDGNTELNYPGVATGNWGCGAFGGSPQLKSLIQIMACAQARRPMAYYTFNDIELRDEIMNVYNLLARYNVTVSRLYKLILRFTTTDVRRNQLHPFLYQALRDEEMEKVTKRESRNNGTDESANESNSKLIEPENVLLSPVKEEWLQKSPDLFSQDEQGCESISIAESDTYIVDETNSKITLNASNNVGQTSRLFDELQKFDEGNGKLNLTEKRTEQNLNLSVDKIDHTMDWEEKAENTSIDTKKKIAKKITDYFSKKSI